MASGPHERDSRHDADDPALPPTLHHSPPGPQEDRPQGARMASPWALPPFGAPVPGDEAEPPAPRTGRRPYAAPYSAPEKSTRRVVDRPDKLVAGGSQREPMPEPVRDATPEPVRDATPDPAPEPLQRIGRPPGGRPVPPDVLVALGPPRTGGGRHHRQHGSPGQGSPPRGLRFRKLLTPVLAVIVLVAATGLGVVVFRWVSAPSTTGLRLAAGDGQSGEAAFAARGLPGNGSSQVLNAMTSVGTTVVAVGSDTTSPIPRPLFLVSTDGGKGWELGRVAGPTGYEPVAGAVGRVVGGDDRWLAVGTDAPGFAGPAARGMWTSSDGRTWTAVDPTRLTVFWSQDRITDLARTDSGFVAVGATTLQDGTLGPVAWVSPDGESWSRVDAARIGTPDKVRGMRAVAARGDQVVALADPAEGDSTSVVVRSPDGGTTWSRTATAVVDVRPEPGALAVAKDGFVLVPTRQTSSNGDVRVYCSTEGERWDQCGAITRLGSEGAGVRGLASSSAGIAAVTESGWERYAVYTSTDGHKWTKSADLGEIPGTLRGLTITDAGVLVAGGDKRGPGDVENLPVLMTAEQGSPAQAVRLETIEGLNRQARDTSGVAASGGTFVAVGSANGDAGIWTSGNNGANWKAADSPDLLGGSGRQALTDVVHGPAGWLAVGGTMTDPVVTRPLLVTSSDARSWRPGPSIDVAPGQFLLAPRVVTAGPKGYVLVGEDRRATGVLPAIWFSPDLKRFTRSAPGSLPAGGAGVRISDVTATPSGFMAVGGSGTADRETGVVWVSPDGLNWTPKGRVLPEDARSAGLRHVVSTSSRVVAVGTAQTEDGAVPFSAVSTDNGAHWEYEWLPVEETATVLGLTATGEGVVAVGTDGDPGEGDSTAWTSEDGLDWTRHTLTDDGLGGSGAQWLGAVAVSGGRVIALGRSTTYAEDHLTIWRSTLSR